MTDPNPEQEFVARLNTAIEATARAASMSGDGVIVSALIIERTLVEDGLLAAPSSKSLDFIHSSLSDLVRQISSDIAFQDAAPEDIVAVHRGIVKRASEEFYKDIVAEKKQLAF